jgi:hypothetical protein
MRGRTALAVVIASTAALAALAAVFVVPGSGPTVTVTGVSFVGNGACGILMTDSGFSAAPGAEEQFSGRVANTEQSPCTIESIQSATPGFTVVGASVPLVVAPGFGNLAWTVQLPLYYDGILTLNFTGNWSPMETNFTSNSSCPSPCFHTQIPSGLEMYSWGEVLPAGWFLVEAGSVGTLIGAVALATARRR